MKVLQEQLPFWPRLTGAQQKSLAASVSERRVKKGTILHNGSEDCVGVFLVLRGQLRAYSLSEEGKEITLYRLLERDMCLLSASCMMKSIQFDVRVEADVDSEVLHIPTPVYKELMQDSAAVANYTNEVMAARFSEVMWLMDQILNKSMDSRIAAFLLEESGLTGHDDLELTHDLLARHLGSAREVISRMLKYFQEDGMISLTRGRIRILDRGKLQRTAEESLR